MNPKIAVAGKGGVGKTTIAGALARVFAMEGHSVIAIDADPAMNLHFSLGIERNPEPLSDMKDLIMERTSLDNGLFKLNPKVDDIVENYGIQKGNVVLLVMGTVRRGGGGCTCPENAFLRALLRHIFRRDTTVVMDCEAGIEHLGRGTARGVDIMLIVVEPSVKAVETATRIKSLGCEIGIRKFAAVLNKVMDTDINAITERISEAEIPIIGVIPQDNAILRAEIKGKAPFDASPSFVERVKMLKNRIEMLLQ
ncbi:MAG: AAA family ATPase [Canidatus Methanoxibalbensis ujae]|nr:AAA family ATPase [Candidatus Methanoxibalbensis ujae]MCW7078176.1 AAA family ATPase [Candidatus Methanoxibalbensis ujae]